MQTIDLSGVDGIVNNTHADFNVAVEKIIERAVNSSDLKDVSAKTIAELVCYAVLSFSVDYVQIRNHVNNLREMKK